MNAVVDHPWRVVAPWYRWERRDGGEPERAAEADRPVVHKFVSTDFVKDYLADPQRTVTFDGGVDVLQRVVAIPDAELYDGDARKWIESARLVPDAAGTRKLFLPAHGRFYLAAVGVHCDRAGFPKVDPSQIDEVGLVVRRRRADVPAELAGAAAELVGEIHTAKAVATVKFGLDAAAKRSRALHPFRSARRDRIALPGTAAVQAAREVELARRRLRTWAATNGIGQTSEGWVPGPDGSIGTWVPMPDEPDELIERAYPMRLLSASPFDPDHAAHDGTIYYAAVPTASDEVSNRGVARFNELDTYEIRVFVRRRHGDCPGPLTWSKASRPFRIASFYDPAGMAQRPVDIRLPDFAQLEASAAMPSVRMTAPPGSHLDFSKFGDIPTKGKTNAGEEICFFSIPLITIIALFVLNLFLPIVVFVFQLWWMLKLKFCIPPSIQFEADLAAELDVTPPELELMAGVDIDVIGGTDPNAIAGVLKDIFDPPPDPDLDAVPLDWRLASHTLDGPDPIFTNNALFQLAIRNGYGSASDPGPRFGTQPTYLTSVAREEVRHP